MSLAFEDEAKTLSEWLVDLRERLDTAQQWYNTSLMTGHPPNKETEALLERAAANLEYAEAGGGEEDVAHFAALAKEAYQKAYQRMVEVLLVY